MSTLLGIGAGPIQTGIFVSGALRGGFSRIVLADVDAELCEAVRHSGTLTVNTAESDSIRTDTYTGIEIYNPTDDTDLRTLTDIASEAVAICTGLPSTGFYRHVAPWLSTAFAAAPETRRYVYTAENSTTAAQELRESVGDFAATCYLDTVIGKMSKVFTADESGLPPLAPGFRRGHLVEAFNRIYTDSAPGIENLGIAGLYPKSDLAPFEAAKLYGHNTAHFVLAFRLQERGCRKLSDAAGHPDLLEMALATLNDECGAALCRKFGGMDPLFEPDAFRVHAEDLVTRMSSPFLEDDVDRVLRDMERKLGWHDRVVGAIRLCRDQGVTPSHLMAALAAAAVACFGTDPNAVAKGLVALWRDAPREDVAPLIDEVVDVVLHLPRTDHTTT